jgi:hypothetical protein
VLRGVLRDRPATGCSCGPAAVRTMSFLVSVRQPDGRARDGNIRIRSLRHLPGAERS